MSEIWDPDVNGVLTGGDDDDWNEDSDSDTPAAKRQHKCKRQPVRPAAKVSEDEDDKVELVSDVDDDFLGQYMTAAEKRHKGGTNRQQGGDSETAELLLGSDDPGDAAPAAAPGVSAGNTIAVLSEAARAAAEREQLIKQQLEAARRLADEPDEEEDDLVPLQPEPVLRRNVPVEDLTFDIDDVVGSDDLETGQPAAGGAAPGGGDADEGRVALKFKTQGNEDVTVRVRACEPLAKAMASFREYVVQQGWGAVDKFLSPDGEKLSGEETAQELELEDGDIIEVYLQH